ncbi:MAG: hypothetical protein Q9165_007655 [Trypethelium subeluteriae]
MTSMQNHPLALIFGVSIILILVFMALPIFILYCYNGGCSRIAERLTGSSRETPRDVEAPPPIEFIAASAITQANSPKAEKSTNDFETEDYNDPFVISDETEDPFTDDFEKDKPSVTESISKAYFEEPGLHGDRTEHRPLTADSFYPEDFRAPPDDASEPNWYKDERGSVAIDTAQGYLRPPSYKPRAAPWRNSDEQTGMPADIVGRDSFESVSLASTRPFSCVYPELTEPKKSLLRHEVLY